MKESQLRKLVRQEIISKLDKMTEGEDPFVPTYGKGDVVHDCPKHVQEIKTGKKGKVTGHTLNEAGDVNFVDVDFGTGKVFKNIPTKKLKVLEMREHMHETSEEPVTGVGDEELATETGDRYDSAGAHPGISQRAFDSQQLKEDLKVKAKKDKEMGSSLGYRLTPSQHKKMLAFLKKHRNNPHVKKLLGTLGNKYSDSISITLDNRPFFVYASYGQLRIGHGGAVSRWNDNMKKALTKYIGEGFLAKPIRLDEAPMDNRFQKEWERNCDVLIKHLDHELRKGPKGQARAQLQLYAKQVTAAKFVPEKMGKLLGTNEAKITENLNSAQQKKVLTALQNYVKKYRPRDGEVTDIADMLAQQTRLPINKVQNYLLKLSGGDDTMIFEGKTRLDEKFGSRKIQALFSGMTGRWGKGREFLNSMAKKYGIEWDKLTDDMVKGPDKKLDRKGIDIIVATKDVEIPASSRYDWRTQIKKGQLLSVTINGKRVWLGRGVQTGGGSGRSFIGLDKRGYSNVRDVLNIDGAVVYHVDPAEQARGAIEKQGVRRAAQAGATALMKAKDVKQANIERYRKALTIKAGEAGKGAIVKMLEKVTKMYEKALQEKLTKMKQGFVPRDSWYADSVKQLGHHYDRMIRSFEEYMRAGATIEAMKVKYKDDPDGAKYTVGYEEKRMDSSAREVKVEYNNLMRELAKIDKAKEFVSVKDLKRY